MKIIAVSKLQPVRKIRDLYDKGYRLFAENYVQEALPKLAELKDLDIEWHFIGTLQKNKVKEVVGVFKYIHSVDSLDLAKKINQVSEQKSLKQKIFIQLNLAQETTKGGLNPDHFLSLLFSLRQLSSVEIVGLMTMPPLTEDPEKSRPYFKQLREIRDQAQKQLPNCKELSMGTSHDYKVAEEEGATYVRLGTILFGERPKKP